MRIFLSSEGKVDPILVTHETNKFITMNGKSIHWSDWSKNNIYKIRDLLNSNGEFLSHLEIQQKINIKCNFLQMLQIRQSLPGEWRKKLSESRKKMENEKEIIINLDNNKRFSSCNPKLKCKQFYWHIINLKNKTPKCCIKWQEIHPKFEKVNDEVWERIFSLPFETTRQTKLQSLQ